MNELVNMRLFSLLAESSQEVTNEEMQNAYGHFVEQVKAIGSSNNNATAMRTLNVTRIEVAHLQTVFRHEQGEKCPKICLPAKNLIPC